ncbi:MAG: flagellar biosynthesis anti-sigma factor FlgM [Endozoicomonadaceae bacterium]|nr:flagellar biosynthesis anti-sigma factor FlgM [Endozoicomonadaceae bacterium]
MNTRKSGDGHGSLLERATQKALAAPDIDMEKVEAARKEIASGQFKINADQLALKMLRLEGAMFGMDMGTE